MLRRLQSCHVLPNDKHTYPTACAFIMQGGDDMAREFARKFYRSKQWQKARVYVLQRDNYLCTMCGSPAEEVHHIIHLTPDNINDPNITINPENLKSLCRDCHHRVHERGKYAVHCATCTGLAFDSQGNLVKIFETDPP